MTFDPHVATEARDDGELRLAAAFARIAAGDGGGLEVVWAEIADDLYGLALWRTGSVEDAEDAVQEAFVRLARARERLARVRRPRAWLLAVAHRSAVDVVRRRRSTTPLDDLDTMLVAADDPERAAEAGQASRELAMLPPEQREAVYLREMLGLTFREIGVACGVATFTAASRCRLGLARLRRALGVQP